ncbi:cadherin-like beta sandwich domain-containing protein, partial [Ruminococcaceae bacterium OttesenSCG-928-D13]|nr:cadherin-like beta sandwich domain-containing protein [Ruminococcaceae bacterium OttesenSCG-928-D13]
GGTGAGSNNSGGTGGRSSAVNPDGGSVVAGGSAGSGGSAGGSGGGGTVLASTPSRVSTGGGTVSTLATYTLTYNVNGGSRGSVPVSQPVYDGLTAYLSDASPTRSGYVFRGWGASSAATTWSHVPNGAYTFGANTTLYAVWTPLPSVAVGRSAVNERSANDGGISDTLIVNLQNGTFVSGVANYLTVSGLPAGLTASVTPIDGTSLLISFTGKATNHAAANSVANAKVSIRSGGITYPTVSSTATAGTLTTGSFAFNFRDSAPAPNAPVFFGSDGTEGPAWADSVTLSSARLNATVNVTGAAVRERGFVYGPAGSGTPSIGNGTKVVSGSGTGSFAAGITGIAAGTPYSFRAYAITDHGTFYSQAGSLTPSALCSMGSTSVLPVREDTATIIGSVLSGGGSTITKVGVAYSLSPNPEVDSTGNALGSAFSILYPSPMTGTFSIDIEGLNPNNRYYVRTFAINGSGVAYGAQVTMNTLMAGLDENTYLQSLVVDGGTMIPAFNKDVHSYMVSVPSARNNIQVTPTIAFKNADMQVTVKDQNWLKANGNPTKSGKQTTITGINASSTNVVYIEVAYQGKTRTYILNMVAQPSGSADLNSLLLKKENPSGADIDYTPAFTKDTSNYTAVVDGATEQVCVELDMGLNTFITSKINGTGTTPIEGVAKAHGTVKLTGPSTVVTIQTTSEDGKTTRTYNLLIIKQVSSSAYLSGLVAGSTSGGSNYTLSPGFDPVKANYSVAVPKDAGGQLYLTPTAAAGAVIEMSGTNAEGEALLVGDGPSYLVSGLSAGSNTVDFIVTSPDGSATAAYTVVVNVPVSDTAELSGLVVRASASNSASSGAAQTLLPTFKNTTTAYTVLVANSMAYAYIAPTAAGGATYCFSDDPEYSAAAAISRGTPLTLPLAYGVNEVYIHAVAASGTNVNTTILTIIRAVSSDARLASITGVDLQPVYGMDQGVYAATVGYESATLNITATANQSNATVALAVGGLAKGSAKGALTSSNVPLAIGDNTFIYTVTAQDGVTRREYTVHVVRQASSNAFLKALDFGESGTGGLPRVITDTDQEDLDGDGDPMGTPTYGASFDPDILTYYGAVDNAVETTRVKAVADDENAAVYVSIKGGAFAPLAGDTTGEIALAVGDNEVKVRVVAQDGTTVLEYILIIVRHAATNSDLGPPDNENPADGSLWATNLKEPGLVQAPGETAGFDPAHLDYTATVVPGIDETDITAKAADANAKVFIRQVGEDGTTTLASAVLGPVTASGTALATGENLFVIEVVAGDGSSKEYTLAITREEPYTGLEAEIDPSGFSFPEGLLTARSGSLVLDHTAGGSVTLTPTGEDKPIGPDSGVSYSLGSFTGDTEVLTAKPTLDEDGKTLLFKAAAGVEVGKEAVLELIIHTPNYEDVTVELSFDTSPKKAVTITVDSNAPGDTDYDGSPASKPGDSDLTIEDTDGANVTGEMDDIIYTYTGTDSKGDS